MLFGDGAGAVVLQAQETDGHTPSGVLSTHLYSDGRHHDALYVDGGPSSTQTTGHLRMQGKEVFRHAVEKLSKTAEASLARIGRTGADVDWIVPHQANLRIIDATARRMGITQEKVMLNIERYGNTSAASIPLAFDAAIRDGRIKRGDLVLMEALGGGFTWGAALARY